MAKKAREGRRRLVIGHLERISSGVFDRYSRVITDLVGGENGIYALYRNNTLHYVGLATDLRKRLNQHLGDRHKGKWNYFSLYLVRSQRSLRDLEDLVLRIAYPKGNVVRGKFGGAPDLRKVLKSQIRTRAIEEINKLMGRARPPRRKRRRGKRPVAPGRGQAPLKGLLKNKRLQGLHKGKVHEAWVYASGRIRYRNTRYISPSAAAAAAVGRKTCNGWAFWRYKNDKGQWVPLSELRT